MTNPQLTDVDDELELMDWIRANSCWVGIGAAMGGVSGGPWWVYTQSKIRKEQNAAQALFMAKQSVQAGNLVLAQSDLTKLVNRYGGTSAGAEGAMVRAA